MKLTKREKTLLGILFGTVFFYGYFYFLLGPQIERITSLKNNTTAYQSEIEKTELLQQAVEQIEMEHQQVNKDIHNIAKDYFPSIHQEDLILLLNQFINNSKVHVEKIGFSPLATETIGDYELNVSTVTLPFQGDYPSIVNLLKSLREYEKKIIVKNLSISDSDDGLLTGSIIIDIYSIPDNPISFIPLLEEKDKNYDVENPFDPFAGYINLKLNSSKSQGLNWNEEIALPLLTEVAEDAVQENLNFPNPEEMMDYEVQKGDTIFSICKKLYGDYSKRNLILEYNNITSPNDIRVGQILIVPKP